MSRFGDGGLGGRGCGGRWRQTAAGQGFEDSHCILYRPTVHALGRIPPSKAFFESKHDVVPRRNKPMLFPCELSILPCQQQIPYSIAVPILHLILILEPSNC